MEHVIKALNAILEETHFTSSIASTPAIRPCCMDHPKGCLIIVFFNTGDNLDAT